MMTGTILIMAGGTGGHVFPGLSVADALKEMGWRVVWLGTQTGMEGILVPKYGYEMAAINFSGLRGKRTITWLTLPMRLLRAFWQSIQVIRRVKPDVVLGMGGYPAFPGGMMAVLLNKPLVIHEQNSILGLTNKVLAKLADRILLGFPEALKLDTNKITFLGNPVRETIGLLAAPEERFRGRGGVLKVLVVGGSLGAHVLNTVVPQALAMIAEALRPEVVHQAGSKHLDVLKKNYEDAGVNGELVAFIDDMAEQYAQCDVVLCRSGALTVSELAAAGVASILIPYPYAVDDHQTCNAKFLSDQQAAILLPQDQLTPKKLLALFEELTREKLQEMAIAARELAKPDATKQVAQVCIDMAGT